MSAASKPSGLLASICTSQHATSPNRLPSNHAGRRCTAKTHLPVWVDFWNSNPLERRVASKTGPSTHNVFAIISGDSYCTTACQAAISIMHHERPLHIFQDLPRMAASDSYHRLLWAPKSWWPLKNEGQLPVFLLSPNRGRKVRI